LIKTDWSKKSTKSMLWTVF